MCLATYLRNKNPNYWYCQSWYWCLIWSSLFHKESQGDQTLAREKHLKRIWRWAKMGSLFLSTYTTVKQILFAYSSHTVQVGIKNAVHDSLLWMTCVLSLRFQQTDYVWISLWNVNHFLWSVIGSYLVPVHKVRLYLFWQDSCQLHCQRLGVVWSRTGWVTCDRH